MPIPKGKPKYQVQVSIRYYEEDQQTPEKGDTGQEYTLAEILTRQVVEDGPWNSQEEAFCYTANVLVRKLVSEAGK